jgi:hypothetical protein
MELLIVRNGKTLCNWELSLKELVGSGNAKLAEINAGKILRNKKTTRMVALVIAAAIMVVVSSDFSYAVEVASNAPAGPERLGQLGVRFWSYVKVIARWACIISGGLEVLRNLNSGDVKGVWKVAFKYVVAYAVVVGLPWIFNEVDMIFA